MTGGQEPIEISQEESEIYDFSNFQPGQPDFMSINPTKAGEYIREFYKDDPDTLQLLVFWVTELEIALKRPRKNFTS